MGGERRTKNLVKRCFFPFLFWMKQNMTKSLIDIFYENDMIPGPIEFLTPTS